MSTTITVIPECTVDTRVIRNLGDNPNTENNLSAQDLKAKFDAAPEAIVQYINAKLIPAVQKKITADGLLKLNNSNGEIVAAEPGVDYQLPLSDEMVARTMLEADVQKALTVADKLVNDAATITLAADKWEENQQKIDIDGVTENNHLIVSAAPESYIVWCENQIRAVSQEEGKVVFKCETTPAEAVAASVLIVG